ncbi:SpoIIE family protein phosphatase [Streptomyces pactum]|uniref:SpoIIE family protein phosphatase n=1 Tax=Streptomyces pactum TaxID=68249 RepID=A0ABS0NKM3_9ACTN|nr:SpoIIE family protein phosphatase [Streptomyces pactum]
MPRVRPTRARERRRPRAPGPQVPPPRALRPREPRGRPARPRTACPSPSRVPVPHPPPRTDRGPETPLGPERPAPTSRTRHRPALRPSHRPGHRPSHHPNPRPVPPARRPNPPPEPRIVPPPAPPWASPAPGPGAPAAGPSPAPGDPSPTPAPSAPPADPGRTGPSTPSTSPDPAAEPAAGPAPGPGLADRLALLAEVTTVLTSTLNLDEALRRLVGLVVPRLADWAVIDLIGERSEVRRVAVVHHEPGGGVSRREDFEGPLPPVPEASGTPLSRVLRGAPPRLVRPEDYTEPPDSGLAAKQIELFRETGMHSAILAPLRGRRQRVLGALTLGRSDQPAPYQPSDLALVDDMARRAGLAVENARLYERQQQVAETMQRHLLPPLPKLRDLEMAARYLPAPHSSQVGGDWYDAFTLPDGALALVVGDVMGHDLQAAANMSQARNMLRAFAWDTNDPPSRIVAKLDHALTNIGEATMASVLFARLTREGPGRWQLHWTNAGHPPPLLVDYDGRIRFLDQALGTLVGTGMVVPRGDATTPLPSQSTVLFYTDGLIESPRTAVTDGLAELGRHAATLVRRPLDDFCDALVRTVRPAENEDDVAVLALRTPASEAT